MSFDKYKLTMGEAGFPLREETFYFSMRRGGPWYIGFDIKPLVFDIVTRTEKDVKKNTILTPAMKQALSKNIRVNCVAKGNWAMQNEPIIVISGPSFLVSVIEAGIIQLHRYIQISTLIKLREMKLYSAAYARSGLKSEDSVPTYGITDEKTIKDIFSGLRIHADLFDYMKLVYSRFKKIKRAVGKHKFYEGGLRSAPTSDAHYHAICSIRMNKLQHTSNVVAANKSNKIAFGSTGHEFIQRFNGDHEAAEALLSRICGDITLPVDTYDVNEGVTALRRLAIEYPERNICARLDSGDILADLIQYFPRAISIHSWNISGDMNPRSIRRIVKAVKKSYIPVKSVTFQAGGYITSTPNMSRNQVSAVYKLCNSDAPTHKQSKGKVSFPGQLRLARSTSTYTGLVYQAEEKISENYVDIYEEVLDIPEYRLQQIIEANGIEPIASTNTQQLTHD